MKKILFFLFLVPVLLFSQTKIFLQITKNLMEKADISLIFKMEKNHSTEKFTKTLAQDLEYSGYFNVEGIKFTDNIEKAKKQTITQIIITGEKKENLFLIKVEDGIEKNLLFEKQYIFSEDVRYLAHIINDDIIQALTGKPGIAKSKILFVSNKTGKYQIYQIDYDGYNLKQITDFNWLVHYPRYIEVNEITFVSYQDGWPKIVKMDISSNVMKTILKEPGLNACVSPCKKTKEIAVVLSKSGNPEIYIADFDGNIKKRLTYNKDIESSPSFSPDGKYIAFVSDRTGKPQIYIMDRDGYGTKRISYISNYCTSPCFSPDGNFIAYVFSSGKGFGLAVYEINTEKTKVISDNLNCEEISWAPDSRHMVYSKTGEKQSLMIINVFTKEIRTLLSENYSCFSPHWFSFTP